MFKKLVLMFSLLATVGVSAVAVGDQASMENISASKPGIFKKVYNFCWGKRSGLAKAGIATVTLLPSAIFLVWIGKDCFDAGEITREDLNGLLLLIPGFSHFILGCFILDEAKKRFCH